MSEGLSGGQRLWRVAAVCGVFLIGAFFWFAQSRGLPSGAPCQFREWLGVPCLLCGGTRAFFAVVQGRWGDAWYFNPLIFPIMLLGGVYLVLWVVEAAVGRRLFGRLWEGLLRFMTNPLFVPIFLLGVFSLWTWHVAAALNEPKPELLRESGLVPKILGTHGFFTEKTVSE